MTPSSNAGDELDDALNLIKVEISFQSNQLPRFSMTVSEAKAAIRTAIQSAVPEKQSVLTDFP